MDLIAQVMPLTYNTPGWQRITTPYLKAGPPADGVIVDLETIG
jgi:hypothetical protein